MSDPIMLTDRDWSKEPRGKRDIIRCAFGRHRPVTMAIYQHMLISRCSCGAIRLGFGHWYEGDPLGRRRRAAARLNARIVREVTGD